jgi:hypothetical protein
MTNKLERQHNRPDFSGPEVGGAEWGSQDGGHCRTGTRCYYFVDL